MSFIPYGKQDITQEDIDAVVSVLESDFLTQGPKVPEFETALAHYTGGKHAVAVNSATSALHVACMALGLGEGDYLWTSPITFVASANCGRYCGASVDFVDIDPSTLNLCPVQLKSKLERARQLDKLPKVVVAVHFAGRSCDMKSIAQLSKEYGFKVIEDASHAIGGAYLNQKIGACHYSDITVFSFHPVKIVTTAEGGAALTNDDVLAQRMSYLRSHGVTRDLKLMKSPSHGPWYYQQIDLGFNYRMTELQAALGCSQMKRVDAFVSDRQRLSARYDELLAALPLSLPSPGGDAYSALHLYVVRVDEAITGVSRRHVFDHMRAAGIGVNVHYIPVHLQPYYSELGFKDGDFPESERYYTQALSLPMFHGMSHEQQEEVVAALRRSLS